MRLLLIILGIILHCSTSSGQRVTVSKEINVRNDFGYEIFGDIDDHVVLFRDLGDEYRVEVFDQEMGYKLGRDIRLDGKRTEMLSVIPNDTSLCLVYTYKVKEGDIIRMHRIDYKGDLLDTLTLDTIPRLYGRDAPRMILSDDQSKVLTYSREKKNKLHVTLRDNRKPNLPIIWRKTILFTKYNLRRDFRSIIPTNHGSVCLLVESDEDEKDHHIGLVYIGSEGERATRIMYDNMYSNDMSVKYDNVNRTINIVGLYSDGDNNDSEGYYFYTGHINDLNNQDTSFTAVPYGLEFIAEVYGKRVGKVKELSYFSINEVIPRRDGGFVFFAEMNRLYSRRSAFGANQFGNNGYGRGWTDYYNEDVISIAVHPDGTEHWRTILYKKQFSQDDNGIYSSYYLFKTPSRIKVLYNDEIKKDNTVSAYIMNPLGQYDRNSVLSTEFQDLKLRFRDAVQVSSTEMIVPSERSLDLSLVKIDWSL